MEASKQRSCRSNSPLHAFLRSMTTRRSSGTPIALGLLVLACSGDNFTTARRALAEPDSGTSSPISTGGAGRAIGGAPSSGGRSISGGAPSSGGTTDTGGVPLTGGAPSSGDTGGVRSTGGATNSGGTSDTGGVPSTGGAPSSGGTDTGGTTSTGGAPSSGGVGGCPDSSRPACTVFYCDVCGPPGTTFTGGEACCRPDGTWGCHSAAVGVTWCCTLSGHDCGT